MVFSRGRARLHCSSLDFEIRENRSTLPAVPAYVYAFADGSSDMRDILGGKGAELAEMTSIGLPVPDGFTVTTEACRAYLAAGGSWPEGLR